MTKKKLGNLPGASEWTNLANAGDVKRMLAWCIHSIRDQTIEPKVAAIMAQIACFLLKATEVHDIEQRLEILERNEDIRQAHPLPRANGEVPIGATD